MEFKEYQSKPITRKAYQLTSNDSIYVVALEESTFSIGKGGLKFIAHETPIFGGWVVYLNDDDIYYCSDEVFRERNIVGD